MNTDNSKSNLNYSGANAAILTTIILFSGILILLPQKFSEPAKIAVNLFTLGIISVIAIIAVNFTKRQNIKAIIQSIFVLGFFSVFYGVTSDYQIIFFNWQDEKLLALDKVLFGSEVSLLMQNVVCFYLTEAMMFAYVIYVPLFVLVAIVAYKNGSSKALGEYLFIVSLGFISCYIISFLFPVASQMYYKPNQYSVSLEGWLFTYFGELIRTENHFPGGSLPSPHCTASTIMLFVLFKNNRKLFWLMLPVVITIYISTVYGRYHYIWDGIAGILLALLLIKIFPFFKSIIDKIVIVYHSLINPISIFNSLSDNDLLED